MSYLFSSSSFPKVRQEGFHTQQQQQASVGHGQASLGAQSNTQSQHQSIPTPNAFDPNSIYTTGALFAEAYRATTADPFARRYEQQQQNPQSHSQSQSQPGTSLDIHDELSFLNPPNSATSESFQQQRPHDIFGVNQPHYSSLSLPHSRPLYSRDDYSSTTPASLHNSYGRPDYYPSGQQQQNNSTTSNHNELTPQQQQQQQQFGLMSSTNNNNNNPPLASSLTDSFNPGGEQSSATGVTRSRSRSRSKVSASRSRVSKRPSLPAPPHAHEEDGEDEEEESPPRQRSTSRAHSSTRPSAIVIPGHSSNTTAGGHGTHHAQTTHQAGQHQHPPHPLSHQHSYSSYHAAGGTASPATWGFPGHSDQYDGSSGTPAHQQQIFGQSYGSQLGPGQSPTAHSGSPPPSAHPDAATKLALANEKRRKRRESHNAVERRRRDNINEKIQELAMLLPEEWLEGGTSPGGNGAGKGPSIAGLLSGTVSGSALGAGGMLDEESKEIKANKGVILRNSVEYIKNLVQLVQVQRTRNQQLESELAQYRNRFGNVMGGGGIPMNGVGMSPGAMHQSSGHTDDEANANAMAGYVLADSLSSPEAFDMKSMFGTGSVGPLDTLGGGANGGGGGANNNNNGAGHGHGHTLSSGSMGMEGVETSSLGAVGMGMMSMNMGGLAHPGGGGGGAPVQGHANPAVARAQLSSGTAAMLVDTTSPSTNGSGEGDEDDDLPRGRRATRFPKVEEEMGTL